MKKLFNLFFLSFFLLSSIKAQHLGTKSFSNFGTNNWETLTGLSIDYQGNYYIAGTFAKQLKINNYSLLSTGGRDIFLLKYNKNNTLIWAKHFGGEKEDNIYSITTDTTGNLYLTGSFQNEINIGNTLLHSKSNTNVFVAKINPDGNIVQTKVLYSNNSAQNTIVHTTTNGNFWLLGSYLNTIELDSLTVLNAQAGLDIFMAKYDRNGKLLNYGQIKGDADEILNDFIVDKTGAIYLAGSYSDNINFGSGQTNSYGGFDLFVAKYDSLANRLWYKIAGGKHDDEVVSIAIDTIDNLYIAGNFIEQTKFGSLIFTAQKEKDIFIIKSRQTNGSPIWLKQFGSSSYNTANSIKVSNNGNIYLAGSFIGTIQNSPIILKSKSKAPNAFIACFEQNGSKKWVDINSSLSENNTFLTYNPYHDVLFAYGYFNEKMDFSKQHIFNKNYKDIYFGKLINCKDESKLNLGNDTSICLENNFKADSVFESYLWSSGEENTNTITPQQSGLYSLKVSDIYGCISEDTVYIDVLQTPVVDLGADILANANDTVTLGITDTLAFYLWSTGDTTNTIHLWMSQFNSPMVVGLTAGMANGCTSYDEVNIRQEQPPLAMATNGSVENDFSEGNMNKKKIIKKEDNYIDYKIYPNPNNGTFYIEIPDIEQLNRIELYDIKGNLINTFSNINSNRYEINLTAFTKGMYLVYIVENDITTIIKVILE